MVKKMAKTIFFSTMPRPDLGPTASATTNYKLSQIIAFKSRLNLELKDGGYFDMIDKDYELDFISIADTPIPKSSGVSEDSLVLSLYAYMKILSPLDLSEIDFEFAELYNPDVTKNTKASFDMGIIKTLGFPMKMSNEQKIFLQDAINKITASDDGFYVLWSRFMNISDEYRETNTTKKTLLSATPVTRDAVIPKYWTINVASEMSPEWPNQFIRKGPNLLLYIKDIPDAQDFVSSMQIEILGKMVDMFRLGYIAAPKYLISWKNSNVLTAWEIVHDNGSIPENLFMDTLGNKERKYTYAEDTSGTVLDVDIKSRLANEDFGDMTSSMVGLTVSGTKDLVTKISLTKPTSCELLHQQHMHDLEYNSVGISKYRCFGDLNPDNTRRLGKSKIFTFDNGGSIGHVDCYRLAMPFRYLSVAHPIVRDFRFAPIPSKFTHDRVEEIRIAGLLKSKYYKTSKIMSHIPMSNIRRKRISHIITINLADMAERFSNPYAMDLTMKSISLDDHLINLQNIGPSMTESEKITIDSLKVVNETIVPTEIFEQFLLPVKITETELNIGKHLISLMLNRMKPNGHKIKINYLSRSIKKPWYYFKGFDLIADVINIDEARIIAGHVEKTVNKFISDVSMSRAKIERIKVEPHKLKYFMDISHEVGLFGAYWDEAPYLSLMKPYSNEMYELFGQDPLAGIKGLVGEKMQPKI